MTLMSDIRLNYICLEDVYKVSSEATYGGRESEGQRKETLCDIRHSSFQIISN